MALKPILSFTSYSLRLKLLQSHYRPLFATGDEKLVPRGDLRWSWCFLVQLVPRLSAHSRGQFVLLWWLYHESLQRAMSISSHPTKHACCFLVCTTLVPSLHKFLINANPKLYSHLDSTQNVSFKLLFSLGFFPVHLFLNAPISKWISVGLHVLYGFIILSK